MSRALLRLSMKAMAKISDIDPGTVIRIENGENAHKLTLQRLREELEARGVVFIDPVDGVHEATVALKWGAQLPKRVQAKSDGNERETEGGLDAASWDDFEETDPVPPEIEALRAFWRDRPEQWQALHEVSRLALLREMRLVSHLDNFIKPFSRATLSG
jgi:transcriptional regulator with XRE-family HTH domain